MHMLLLVERDPSQYASWPSLITKNRIENLSVTEVVSRYRGFEGDLVAFFEFQGDDEELKKYIDKFLELKSLGSCFLIHVVCGCSRMPIFLKGQVTKVGYDVGFCQEESTLYSSIFHEILFGFFSELVEYRKKLNDFLLFEEKTTAEEYVLLHNNMSANGKPVEDYIDMVVYEIWEHNL